MNKNGKGKVSIWIWIALIGLAVFLIGYYLANQEKTVNEHKVPADISKSESGTGIQMKLYDAQGNPISIPDWFSSGSSGYTIVNRPSTPTCTVVSQCAGYLTNPKIMCWTGKCVLGGIASIDLGVSVTNPSSSQLTFLNILPVSVSPASWNINLNKSSVNSLAPGNTVTWMTLSPISVAVFEGTTQTFAITVNGTNQYTSQIVQVSDSLQLQFSPDPTGSLTVSVVSPA